MRNDMDFSSRGTISERLHASGWTAFCFSAAAAGTPVSCFIFLHIDTFLATGWSYVIDSFFCLCMPLRRQLAAVQLLTPLFLRTSSASQQQLQARPYHHVSYTPDSLFPLRHDHCPRSKPRRSTIPSQLPPLRSTMPDSSHRTSRVSHPPISSP